MSPLFILFFHLESWHRISSIIFQIQVAPLMCPCWQSTMAFLRLWPLTVIPTWEAGDVWRWKLFDNFTNIYGNSTGFFWVTIGMRCVCCLTCLLYIDIPCIYFMFCASNIFHWSASQLPCNETKHRAVAVLNPLPSLTTLWVEHSIPRYAAHHKIS